MRLHVLSDTHFEMHRDHGISFINSLDSNNIDILILAGDITVLRDYYWANDIYSSLCRKYNEVVMVVGNHEYYSTDIATADKHLSAIESRLSNLHTLRLGIPRIIGGQRFIGGTLWFKDSPSNRRYQNQMNDFHVIQGGFEKWVYNQNTQTVDNLEKNLQAGDILVTHHLPTYTSVAPKFAGQSLNRFFVCDIEDLINDRKPKLAIHGHSHIPVDHIIGPTRIYSNPFGYPNEGENPNFESRLEIDI